MTGSQIYCRPQRNRLSSKTELVRDYLGAPTLTKKSTTPNYIYIISHPSTQALPPTLSVTIAMASYTIENL